jgi:hypothetical protein
VGDILVKIKTLCVNDIHLGHPTTPTSRIVENLQREFNRKTLLDVDILCIPGDIYEKQIRLSDPDTDVIYSWMYQLLRDCAITNTLLRVLHGTHSHDFNQARLFETINVDSEFNCDVRYVNELSIEHIPQFNIHILYIPDEWRGSCKQTQKEVEDLMYEMDLDMVDISLMHGFFSWQTPDKNVHDENFYSSITRYYVNIGHVHTYSEWKNIRAPGSFDCTRHGETYPKGYMGYQFDTSIPYDVYYTFYENKYATQYKTVRVGSCNTKSEVENEVNYVISEWRNAYPNVVLRPLLFVKVVYNPIQDFEDIFISFKERYKAMITWSFVKEEVIRVVESVEVQESAFEPTPLTETTIIGVYEDLLSAISGVDRSAVMNVVTDTKRRLEKG